MLGYLPILKKPELPPVEMVNQMALDMDTSGQHLLHLINDLLDISKIEAGQMHLQLEAIKARTFVDEIIGNSTTRQNQGR